MTAPTPEEVLYTANAMAAEVRRHDFTADPFAILARWHLAHSTPAPDERRKRVVETARAAFVATFARSDLTHFKTPAPFFTDADTFEAAADAYLNGGAS